MMTAHERIHVNMRMLANRRGQRSLNCWVCGQCEEPDDFRLESDGPMPTVFRLVPLNDNAKGWVADNVSRTEGFQPEYPTLFVEHGYIDALLGGIDLAGLTVDTVARARAQEIAGPA